MKPNVCKICGAPGVIYTSKGEQIQRNQCAFHWRAYLRTLKAERGIAAKAAAIPDGWQPSDAFAGSYPADGVTRLTISHHEDAQGQVVSGQARFEQGSLMRVVPLHYPRLWELLAGIFLAQGYRFVTEGRTTLVLERKSLGGVEAAS